MSAALILCHVGDCEGPLTQIYLPWPLLNPSLTVWEPSLLLLLPIVVRPSLSLVASLLMSLANNF